MQKTELSTLKENVFYNDEGKYIVLKNTVLKKK